MPSVSMDLGLLTDTYQRFPKMMGIGRRLAKLTPHSSIKAMIEVDFGVYLSGHQPKPTATQSSQTLGYR